MTIKNDTRKNEEYRIRYFELTQEPIPLFTEDLELQDKIEQCVIRSYLRGYELAKKRQGYRIAQLKYHGKVQRERIKGLEKLLKEKKSERTNKKGNL